MEVSARHAVAAVWVFMNETLPMSRHRCDLGQVVVDGSWEETGSAGALLSVIWKSECYCAVC